MCADYTPSRKERIRDQFELDLEVFDLPDFPEAYPGYMAPILRSGQDASTAVECVPAMFGMVPHWADFKLARQTYNARTETVATKPSYRNAWKRHQFCIIPADNFYEPCYEADPEGKKSIRWKIWPVDERPLGIAGIWEWRANGPDGAPLVSCSMLTVNADGHPLMKRFHKPNDEKRMVVILDPEMYRPWLNGTLSAEEIAGLLRTYPAELLASAASPIPPRPKKIPAK